MKAKKTLISQTQNDLKWESLFLKVLKNLDQGLLQIALPDGRVTVLGQGNNGVTATMQVLDPKFFKYCALYGDIGMGIAYNKGLWSTPDLSAILNWFRINVTSPTSNSTRAWSVNFLKLIHKLTRQNTKCEHINQLNEQMGDEIKLFTYFPEPAA